MKMMGRGGTPGGWGGIQRLGISTGISTGMGTCVGLKCIASSKFLDAVLAHLSPSYMQADHCT